MPLDELLAYSGTILGVTTILVQLIKTAVFDGFKLSDTQRNAYLRLINYALNFGLLLAVVLTHNAFQPQDLIAYLGLAFGQSVFSHAGFKTLQGDAPPEPPTFQVQVPQLNSTAGVTEPVVFPTIPKP